MKRHYRGLMLLAVLLTLCTLATEKLSAITVDSLSNIFATGQLSAFDGILPVEISVAPGTQSYYIASSSGSATPWVGVDGTLVGIDGGNTLGSLYPSGTNVFSPNQISSFTLLGRYLFLTGVFTDGTLAGSPFAVDYTTKTGDSSFSPVLNEVFFMGDGLTGTGSGATQTFNVPAGATKLYLGFVDGAGFIGNAGAYNDNSGAYEVELVAVVPEPSSVVVLVGSFVGLVARRRK